MVLLIAALCHKRPAVKAFVVFNPYEQALFKGDPFYLDGLLILKDQGFDT